MVDGCGDRAVRWAGRMHVCSMHGARYDRNPDAWKCSKCPEPVRSRGLCERHEMELFREVDDIIEWEGGRRGDPEARASVLARMERELD